MVSCVENGGGEYRNAGAPVKVAENRVVTIIATDRKGRNDDECMTAPALDGLLRRARESSR